MASRLASAKPATRLALFGRCAIAGPPGSGKTLTALHLANAMVPGGRFLGLDTENDEMRLYAPSEGSEYTIGFEHLPWAAPYDPDEFCGTLAEASGSFDVLIVDSFSHFWSGRGGVLTIADGRFGGWKDARPAHEKMIEAVKAFRGHVILCVRSKMDYVQEAVTESSGRTKQVVRQIGMAPIADGNLGYEVNLALDMDVDHEIHVSKSRAGSRVPVGTTYAAGMDTVESLGKAYAEWLMVGEPLLTEGEIQALKAMIVSSMTAAQAAWAKAEWVRRGIPKLTSLTKADVVNVMALMDDARQTPAEANPAEAMDEGAYQR